MAGIKNCPDCCFMGDIDDDKVYPFGVLTEEESDQKYAKKEYEQKVEKNTADIKNLGTSKADSGNVYSKEEIDEKLENVKVDAYTKSETDSKFATSEDLRELGEETAQQLADFGNEKADKTALSSLEGIVNTKASKSEVTAITQTLETKADKSNTYTKQEVDTKISNVKVDAYTKAETDDKLNAKADKQVVSQLEEKINSLGLTVENGMLCVAYGG